MGDMPWQKACRDTNLPFFVLHKESLQDPSIHEHNEKRFRSMAYKFYGQRMYVYNKLAKDIFVKSGICNPDVIKVTGAPRFDPMMHKIQNGQIQEPQKRVTLFSFHHAVGRTVLEIPKACFSKSRDIGFVNYFDKVHGQVIEFAKNHPDIEVIIKPKWGGQWFEEIKQASLRETGINPEDLDNLHISTDYHAQDLIETSSVILGINSTTLLEALLIGRPVILPFFEEAADKYRKKLYFQTYENQIFNVVTNPEGLEQAILDEMDGKCPKRTMPSRMIKDYLGFNDDQSTNRVVNRMLADIEAIKRTGGAR